MTPFFSAEYSFLDTSGDGCLLACKLFGDKLTEFEIFLSFFPDFSGVKVGTVSKLLNSSEVSLKS